MPLWWHGQPTAQISADTLGKHSNLKRKIFFFFFLHDTWMQLAEKTATLLLHNTVVHPFQKICTTNSSHSITDDSIKCLSKRITHWFHFHLVSSLQIVKHTKGRCCCQKRPNDWNIDSTTKWVPLTPSCHLVTMSSRAPTSHPDPLDLYSGTWRSVLAASAPWQLLFLWQN